MKLEKMTKEEIEDCFKDGLCPNCETDISESDFSDEHKLTLEFRCSGCGVGYRVPISFIEEHLVNYWL